MGGRRAGRRIVVVGYEGTTLLDVACVVTGLGTANLLGASPAPYAVVLASSHGRPVCCHEGVELRPHRSLERTGGPLDTLVVAGGPGHRGAAADPTILGNVRRLARTSRRVASVGGGATVLAATGVLDRRAARRTGGTTAAGPALAVVEPDGADLPAAVMAATSAVDLAVALVVEDHGWDLARSVVRTMMGSGGWPAADQPALVPPRADPVDTVESHVRSHLTGDLTVRGLADVAGMSPRHLTRIFASRLGTSPARYVRLVRLEAAAELLGTSALPVARIAARCGFGSTEALRQAFVRRYETTPSQYRLARHAA